MIMGILKIQSTSRDERGKVRCKGFCNGAKVQQIHERNQIFRLKGNGVRIQQEKP